MKKNLIDLNFKKRMIWAGKQFKKLVILKIDALSSISFF